MEHDTERLIRNYIRYRMAPPFACLFIVLGLLASFLIIGLLGAAKSCERHLHGGDNAPHSQQQFHAKGVER